MTGQPGSGKSTFVNSNPHLVCLDPERGGDSVADPKALRFTPPPDTDPSILDLAYLDFMDRIIARKRKGATDIKMVAIDTLDKLVSIFQKALCLREKTRDVGDVGGGHGKGYFIVRDAIFGMLDKAYQAGLGWIIIAHTCIKVVEVGQEKKQISGLSVSDSYKGAVFQECAHMLFIEHGVNTIPGKDEAKIVAGKKITKKGKPTIEKVRKLKTRPGGLWQGGDTNDVKVRVPLAEEYVLPKLAGWGLLEKAYGEAAALLVKGVGT